MTLTTFKSVLLEKKNMTEDVLFFRISCPEDFSFKAGQYISIKCAIGDETKWKAYSILSPPSQKGTLDLCIKIIPGGFASAMLSQAKEGDELYIRGPMGHFIFAPDSKEHWFLAAGTGVAPFYSMLKEHIHLKGHKFTLLLGSRHVKSIILHDELVQMDKENENFTFLPVVSRESFVRKGHVQDFLPENLNGKNFYICGLKELVLEAEEILLRNGVEKERIKKERYT